MSSAPSPLAQIDAPGLLRKVMFPGVLGLVAGIVLQFFKLFDAQPKEAIELLKAWGPASMLGLVALAVIAGLMTQLMDISRDGVEAQRKMADAMGRIAEKDDRQIQEIQTLTAFTAQESRGTRQQLGEVATQLKHNSECLQKLIEQLSERELAKRQFAEEVRA